MVQGVAEDFWRKYIIDQPEEFIAYLQTKIKDPNGFAKLFENIKSLETRIIPIIENPEMPSIISFRRLFAELKKLWPEERANISNLLNDDNLNGKIYGSKKPDKNIPNKTIREVKISAMLKMMDAFTCSGSSGIPLFKKFENFTKGKIKSATKKNKSTPTHYLFELCERLASISADLEKEMADFLLYLKLKWFKYAKKEIDIKKLHRNEQFFDDLLHKVRHILENNNGSRFRTLIRKKYHAALVDEFQDTDFIQYDIFKTLFKSQNQTLFLIGDPKQAIYGFRGADLFSYFKAANIADRKLTLSTNWRSKPELIDAVNAIFSNHSSPFIFKDVCFENALPGKSDSKKLKSENTVSCEAPLKLWYLMPQSGLDKKNKINKDAATQRITLSTASEILRLLTKETKVETNGEANGEIKQVQPEDIAVLVRTNLQARAVKTALQNKGIAAVIYSAGNVFSTSQAFELAGFLGCLIEPANEGKLKSALTGDMLGINANNLEPEANCYIDLDKWFADFTRYANMWQCHGFYRMFRLFLVEHSVKARVLSLPDGERYLTNFLHLAELIHQESVEKHLGPVGLLKWLNQQIDKPSLNEIEQLRLESDARAVKIITIHKSKGLEFQIVFCPFCWEGSILKNRPVFFHDPKADFQLTLDISHKTQPEHMICAQNEILAENLRLLYVALTRARQKCYLVWGRIEVGETSALAYLFHHHLSLNDNQQKDIIKDLKKIMKDLDNDQFILDLEKLENRSHGTVEILPMPTLQSAELKIPQFSLPHIKCREFSSYIDKSRLVSSYSSLIQSAVSDDYISAELQGHNPDPIDLPDPSEFKSSSISTVLKTVLKKEQNIFEFPRGALAGIFFHDILENMDFQGDIISEQRELIVEKLQFYGFDLAWQDVILNMLDQIISVSLSASNQSEFSLSDLAKNDRANEMEFYFPVKKVSPFQLKKVFEKYGTGAIADKFPQQIEKLFFSLSRGFMKGFIDLVFQYNHKFYLVDWKSNYLGSHLDYYHENKLFEIMNSDYYILQYHLYALALHQYLKCKYLEYDYEKGFGGIYYMFLRGVSKEKGPDFGIFYDLPSLELINALGRCLIPEYA